VSRLVLLAVEGERVWAAPAGRPADAVVVGRVVRAWRAWDAVDHAGVWLGAYRSRYAAAHAVVDHAQPRPPATSRQRGAPRRRPADLPAIGHRRAAPGAVELGELLRAARLAVACGGTAGLARREQLLAELSHAHPPARRARARRLARALGAAAGLAAADLAAGPAPAVLADPAGLPGRLLAAQAALRPAARRRVARRQVAHPAPGRGVAGWPARLGKAVPRGVEVAG
jgi:hypothetical protein